jgi:hypothetical protein
VLDLLGDFPAVPKSSNYYYHPTFNQKQIIVPQKHEFVDQKLTWFPLHAPGISKEGEKAETLNPTDKNDDDSSSESDSDSDSDTSEDSVVEIGRPGQVGPTTAIRKTRAKEKAANTSMKAAVAKTKANDT